MPQLVASSQITLTDLNDAIIAGTAPANPVVDTLWIDTSINPAKLKKWSGSAWVVQSLDLASLDPDADDKIEDATVTIGNILNDAKIDFTERVYVKEKVMEIAGVVLADTASMPTVASIDTGMKGEVYSVRKSATNAGLSTSDPSYVAVSTEYNNLKTYLDAMSPKPWDVSTGNKDTAITITASTWRDKWLKYYQAVDKLIEVTSDKLRQNVDDIEVGARNLIRNTDFNDFKSGDWNTWNGNTQTGDVSTITLDSGEVLKFLRVRSQTGLGANSAFGLVSHTSERMSLIAGQEYTLSFLVACHSNTKDDLGYTYIINDGGTNQKIQTTAVTGHKIYGSMTSPFVLTVYEYEITFTATYTSSTARIMFGGYTSQDFTGGGSYGLFYISRPILVQGNKKATWTPAPEDVKDAIGDVDSGLRDDLNITAPLPTDIKMDANGITAGANQSTKYARLDYRGLYIYGGAIQIAGGLPDSQIANASKWNGQGTYIDENGIYTGELSADQINTGKLTAIDIEGSTIISSGALTGTTTITGGKFTSRYDYVTEGMYDESVIDTGSFVQNSYRINASGGQYLYKRTTFGPYGLEIRPGNGGTGVASDYIEMSGIRLSDGTISTALTLYQGNLTSDYAFRIWNNPGISHLAITSNKPEVRADGSSRWKFQNTGGVSIDKYMGTLNMDRDGLSTFGIYLKDGTGFRGHMTYDTSGGTGGGGLFSVGSNLSTIDCAFGNTASKTTIRGDEADICANVIKITGGYAEVKRKASLPMSSFLVNSWVPYGSPYTDPTIHKTADGMVILEGLVKNGTANHIGTLPVGYRPAGTGFYLCMGTASAVVRVDVRADGVIIITGTAPSFVSLAGISFEAVN